MSNYDFQEEVGDKERVMVYFKIVGETREKGRSKKNLIGFDLNGRLYEGVGIIDSSMTLRATQVKKSSMEVFSTGGQYFITEDGQNVFTKE